MIVSGDIELLLNRLCSAVERQAAGIERSAAALERIERLLSVSTSADAGASNEGMSVEELSTRDDGLTAQQQEWLAAIELLEDEGQVVPAEAYRKIGLDPPRREQEPTEDEVNRPQPGSQEEERGE